MTKVNAMSSVVLREIQIATDLGLTAYTHDGKVVIDFPGSTVNGESLTPSIESKDGIHWVPKLNSLLAGDIWGESRTYSLRNLPGVFSGMLRENSLPYTACKMLYQFLRYMCPESQIKAAKRLRIHRTL